MQGTTIQNSEMRLIVTNLMRSQSTVTEAWSKTQKYVGLTIWFPKYTEMFETIER